VIFGGDVVGSDPLLDPPPFRERGVSFCDIGACAQSSQLELDDPLPLKGGGWEGVKASDWKTAVAT
jgi:hypothetical protein